MELGTTSAQRHTKLQDGGEYLALSQVGVCLCTSVVLLHGFHWPVVLLSFIAIAMRKL